MASPPPSPGARGRLQTPRSQLDTFGRSSATTVCQWENASSKIEHVLQRTGFPQSRRPDTDLQEEGLHSGWAEGTNIDQALSHFAQEGSDVLGGAWYYSSPQNANPDLNILPMPMPANDKDSDIIDSVLEGLTINTKAKEKAAAVKLLAWMVPEGRGRSPAFSSRRGKHSYPWRLRFHPRHAATKSIREAGQVRRPDGSVRFDQQPYTPTAFVVTCRAGSSCDPGNDGRGGTPGCRDASWTPC